jgi:acyl-CoA thioester hydrolase
LKIRIYYEDTDAGGVVFYANYLKYCERARSEIFFENDSSPHIIDDNGDESFFVVKDLKASYFSPARLADIIEVKSEVLNIKNASVVLKQTIYKDEIKLFSMEVKLAFLKNNKPSKIPQYLKEIFLCKI